MKLPTKNEASHKEVRRRRGRPRGSTLRVTTAQYDALVLLLYGTRCLLLKRSSPPRKTKRWAVCTEDDLSLLDSEIHASTCNALIKKGFIVQDSKVLDHHVEPQNHHVGPQKSTSKNAKFATYYRPVESLSIDSTDQNGLEVIHGNLRLTAPGIK